MQVKICGITNLEDALAAAAAGADLLGFNFYPKSPRCLTLEGCARITTELRRRGVASILVGVFVNATPETIELTTEKCALDLAQLSGDETPAQIQALGEKAFKALRPTNAGQLRQALAAYPLRNMAPSILIDAHRPGEYGGTGQRADWDLAAGVAGQMPVLLAGGLTPENVAKAVQRVNPWGVDVASGVECAPGRKDAGKMAAFVKAAQTVRKER
jgi:phosphoribosylanthranilate isomerase